MRHVCRLGATTRELRARPRSQEALHGLREATRDVDSTTAVDAELREAVARVAARHGLAPRWLNDRARPYLPVTFDESACEVLVDRPGLTVLGAPLDQVFLMKVFASRAADVEDIEVLWEHCSYADAGAGRGRRSRRR
jgi:hypothetical protein